MYFGDQPPSSRRLAGIGLVAFLHLLLVYGLVNGLARHVVEAVKAPLETRLIEQVKPPSEPESLPPPPKFDAPPPPFIPPPEVRLSVEPPPASQTFAVVSMTPPPVTAPVAPAAPPAPKAVQRTPAATLGCPTPEYPSISRRLGETGTVVLAFLIDADGSVLSSQIKTSSGSARLDEAARKVLARCRFKPGTADGVAEQSWANLPYTWRLQ